MLRFVRPLGLCLICLALGACGNQDSPSSPAEKPSAEPQDQSKACTDPLKSCAGGAVPTVDPTTCAQTCPGE